MNPFKLQFADCLQGVYAPTCAICCRSLLPPTPLAQSSSSKTCDEKQLLVEQAIMDSTVDSSLQCILAVLAFLQDLKSVEMNEEHEDAEKQEDHKSRTTCTVIELPAAIVVESYGCRPWQNECKFCFMSLRHHRKVKVEALQLLKTLCITLCILKIYS